MVTDSCFKTYLFSTIGRCHTNNFTPFVTGCCQTPVKYSHLAYQKQNSNFFWFTIQYIIVLEVARRITAHIIETALCRWGSNITYKKQHVNCFRYHVCYNFWSNKPFLLADHCIMVTCNDKIESIHLHLVGPSRSCRGPGAA